MFRSTHRLCRYEPTDGNAFGAHTDTSFFTLVPFASPAGLEVFEPSTRAWVCPELDATPESYSDVLAMPGEFLELASDAAWHTREWVPRGATRSRDPPSRGRKTWDERAT